MPIFCAVNIVYVRAYAMRFWVDNLEKPCVDFLIIFMGDLN